MAKLYTGTVAFIDGVHYPVGKDGEPDLGQPLRWTADGYRDADKNEALHNDVHRAGGVDVEPEEAT